MADDAATQLHNQTNPQNLLPAPDNSTVAAYQEDPQITALYQKAADSYVEALKTNAKHEQAQRNADLGERIAGHLSAIGLGAAGGAAGGMAGMDVLNRVHQDSQNARVGEIGRQQAQLGAMKNLIDMHNAGHLKGFIASMKDKQEAGKLAQKKVEDDQKMQRANMHNDFLIRKQAADKVIKQGNLDERTKGRVLRQQLGEGTKHLREMGLDQHAKEFEESLSFRKVALHQQELLSGLNRAESHGQHIDNLQARKAALQARIDIDNAKAKNSYDMAKVNLEKSLSATHPGTNDPVFQKEDGKPMTMDDLGIPKYEEINMPDFPEAQEPAAVAQPQAKTSGVKGLAKEKQIPATKQNNLSISVPGPPPNQPDMLGKIAPKGLQSQQGKNDSIQPEVKVSLQKMKTKWNGLSQEERKTKLDSFLTMTKKLTGQAMYPEEVR